MSFFLSPRGYDNVRYFSPWYDNERYFSPGHNLVRDFSPGHDHKRNFHLDIIMRVVFIWI